MTSDPLDLFAGAKRREQYDEDVDPDEHDAVRAWTRPALEVPPALNVAEDQAAEPAAVQAVPEVVPQTRPAPPAVARQGLLRRRRFPTAEDSAERADAETLIRQFTATRAVNVLVANPKASGKTVTSIILGGVLAEVRGGSVAITEVTPAAGDLAARAEGTPARGLTELLQRVDQVTSAGMLAGFTAPQTSRAAVIGSRAGRPELTPEDVVAVRRVLDTYYQLTVTDSGNDPMSDTFDTAIGTADAVLVPVVCSLASIRGAQQVLLAIANNPQAEVRGLLHRVVIMATHDGGPEDPELTQQFVTMLAGLAPTALVIEVPYDPAIRLDVSELSLASLSLQSEYAWRQVARGVVDALRGAPDESPIPTA